MTYGSAHACAGGGDSTLGEQGGGNSVRRYQACNDNTCEINEVWELPEARSRVRGRSMGRASVILLGPSHASRSKGGILNQQQAWGALQ